MIHPLLYVIGYCVVAVSEDDAVRLVNGAAMSGLVYHDMGARDGFRRFRVSPVACVRAEELCLSLGIRMTVQRRVGLPYLFARLVKRCGIVAGVLLCVAFACFSSRVVWDIKIVGNSAVSDEEIIGTLGECGFGVGSVIDELDIDRIENRFLIISDEISWISVNVLGTVAEVEVRETVTAEPSPDYVCSNLVAARSGRVVELFEVRGDIQVELGEDVSEGQLLVSGVYGNEQTSMRFLRSKGQVLAQCDREFSVTVPLEYEKKVYTGEKKIKKSLIFFEKEVKFFGNSGNSYASCDTIEEVKYFDLFGLGKLPFGIRTVTVSEYVTETATMSEEQAAEEAVYLLWQRFGEQAPDAKVVGKTLSGTVDGGVYRLDALVRSVENIAVEREVEVEIIKKFKES